MGRRSAVGLQSFSVGQWSVSDRPRRRDQEPRSRRRRHGPYSDAWWPPGEVFWRGHTLVHGNYEFLSAIGGSETFRPSFQDAYAVQRILDAIERADETSAWVSIHPDS